MMKIASLFTLFTLLVVASTSFAQDGRSVVKTDTVKIGGMECVMCERRIEKNIKKVSGVQAIEADSENELAIVTYDPAKISRESIEAAIAKIGYDAGKHPADKVARENLPGCCNPNAKH